MALRLGSEEINKKTQLRRNKLGAEQLCDSMLFILPKPLRDNDAALQPASETGEQLD